jgi:hypothetical protein
MTAQFKTTNKVIPIPVIFDYMVDTGKKPRGELSLVTTPMQFSFMFCFESDDVKITKDKYMSVLFGKSCAEFVENKQVIEFSDSNTNSCVCVERNADYYYYVKKNRTEMYLCFKLGEKYVTITYKKGNVAVFVDGATEPVIWYDKGAEEVGVNKHIDECVLQLPFPFPIKKDIALKLRRFIK